MESQTILVPLNDRQLPHATDALIRHSVTMELLDAQMRQLRLIADAAQRRLSETINALAAANDVDLPDRWSARLVGNALEIKVDAPDIEQMLASVSNHSG